MIINRRKQHMPLTIFNGSPRSKKSNSKLLIEQFIAGYQSIQDESVNIHYLAVTAESDQHLKAFTESENCLIVFPLYTDAMPAIVKAFLEVVFAANIKGPKKVGFIVQSGFRESIHSSFVERYLKKFTVRLGYEYLGTVIKGGVEGIQIMPPSMTKKLFENFRELGSHFAQTGSFKPELVVQLAQPYKLSLASRWFMQLAPSFLKNFYWNSNLKKHKAYSKRFDRPFVN